MTTSENTSPMHTPLPDPALRRLEKLVGTWELTGRTLSSTQDNITGWTRFEWMPGGFFLQAVSEIAFQGARMQSVEIIAYDPESKTFPSHVYSSMSGTVLSYEWDVQGKTVIHSGLGATYTGAFSEDDTTLIGGWRPNEGTESTDGNSYDATMRRTDAFSRASTRNSKWIKASPESLYRAWTSPAALAVWFAPGNMAAKIHWFDGRVGGGYEMSLSYLSPEHPVRGKTTDREDRYTARFVELTPPSRIVEAITFDSGDPAFSGEMILEVTFEAKDGGTMVSVFFKGIPSGIRPEDNEAGTQQTLENLARYIEAEMGRSEESEIEKRE